MFTYSIGCFQDRGALVATGGSLAENGTITYAQLKCPRLPQDSLQGPAASAAVVMLALFHNDTLADFQDLDALLPGISY